MTILDKRLNNVSVESRDRIPFQYNSVKGLLPKADLFIALHRLIVDKIIPPESNKTQDVGQLDVFLSHAPLLVKSPDGGYRRCTSSGFHQALEQALENETFAIVYVGTQGWTYPDNAHGSFAISTW